MKAKLKKKSKNFHAFSGNNKEVVVYYISSHGFGHLTRCMAQIEKIIKYQNNNYLLICGEKQIEFAKRYLQEYKDRVTYRILDTDIGLINKEDSLEVDKVRLEEKLREFLQNLDNLVENEIEYLSRYNILGIITDISPIGILVAEKLGLKVKLVSNFTWYQQYHYLGLAKDIVDKYFEIDQKVEILYRYLLHLNFTHMKCEVIENGFISRRTSMEKIENIKETYGRSIFISVGKSASLEEIEIENYNDTVFVTQGIEVIRGNANIVRLPVNIEDTQNYIAASEFIISKAGWGTIAEAVDNNIPMVLLERDGVLEDTHHINELRKDRKAISISLEELKKIDYLEVKKKLSKELG